MSIQNYFLQTNVSVESNTGKVSKLTDKTVADTFTLNYLKSYITENGTSIAVMETLLALNPELNDKIDLRLFTVEPANIEMELALESIVKTMALYTNT